MKTTATIVLSAALALLFAGLSACEKKESPSAAADHGHEHAPAEAPKASTAGHGGAVIQLGSATIGDFEVAATRDEGDIVAGKDAPIDVTVTPRAGAAAKAAAVRFWIGVEDAKGSVKAKAAIENPAEPNRWHTHAEVPNPLPVGRKLWVEIETEAGARSVGSFELRS